MGKNSLTGSSRPDIFYAKILLFGEYSIIFDSKALTVPFSHFAAGLSFINKNTYTDYEFASRSNEVLRSFLEWVEMHSAKGELKGVLDLDRFRNDIHNGIFLESTIPQGYGLGSSGALCAAVYSRYAVNRIGNDISCSGEDIFRLRNIFAALESWFHGTSSGLDPLNCYFRHPFVFHGNEEISFIGIPEKPGQDADIFLIDTGCPVRTEPLVNFFLKKSRGSEFFGKITRIMIPAVNKCINSLINSDLNSFMSDLKKLSCFQLQNMEAMIPETHHDIWEGGLVSDEYYIKLCGSGGGGYLLGFTTDLEKTTIKLAAGNTRILPVYRKFLRQNHVRHFRDRSSGEP
jgi:mevalonate kinase